LAFNDNGPAPDAPEAIGRVDAYFRYTFATAGTYYISVSNANNTHYDPVTGNGDTAGVPHATGSYTLALDTRFYDSNDSLLHAVPLGPLSTTAVTVNGGI